MAFLLPAFSKFLQKHIQVSRFFGWLEKIIFKPILPLEKLRLGEERNLVLDIQPVMMEQGFDSRTWE